MGRFALLIPLAILSTSSGVAAPSLTDVKLGAYSTTMSLDTAQKVQGGEIKCDDKTRIELTVRDSCALIVDKADEFVIFAKSGDGITLQVGRVVPVPTGMAWAEAFAQVRQTYQELGEPHVSSFTKNEDITWMS